VQRARLGRTDGALLLLLLLLLPTIAVPGGVRSRVGAAAAAPFARLMLTERRRRRGRGVPSPPRSITSESVLICPSAFVRLERLSSGSVLFHDGHGAWHRRDRLNEPLPPRR